MLWRGVRVAAGVSGGATVAMGAVAKRAPAEACWGGLRGLPLAFRASRSDSVRERRAFTSVSKNQLYIRKVKKNDVYHYIFDTRPSCMVKMLDCGHLSPISFALSGRRAGRSILHVHFFGLLPLSPARLAGDSNEIWEVVMQSQFDVSGENAANRAPAP